MESSGLGGAGTDVELFDDVPVAGCDPYAPNAADCYIYDIANGKGVFNWFWSSKCRGLRGRVAA
jgi:hypothetical protein